MMKPKAFILVVLLIVFLCPSCSFFKRSNDTELVYTVNVSSLNVRSEVKKDAKILGVLQMGDTVRSTHITPYRWVQFDYKDGKGYVNEKYLKGHRQQDMAKVSNMKLDKTPATLRDTINHYVNWRKGVFWLIAIGSIFLAWAFVKIAQAVENACDFLAGDDYSYSMLPYVFGFVGGLFGLAYMFWREEVMQALFVTQFWWFPAKGSGWLMYFLWGTAALGVITYLSYFIRDVVRFKARAVFTMLFNSLAAVILFVCGMYLGVAVIVIIVGGAILWLASSIINAGGSYSGSSVRNSSSGSGGGLSPEQRREEDRQFRERVRESDEARKLAQLKSDLEWENMKMRD